MDMFPSCRYHKVLAPTGRMFNTQEEIDAAGEGWVDTPAAFGLVTHPPEQVPVAPPAEESAPPPDPELPNKLSPAKRAAGGLHPFPAKIVKRMKKLQLYDLAKNPPYELDVPENIDDTTRTSLLELILPLLPEK